MTKKKTRHILQASLIVVGEGAHDKAFLNHMKELYDERDTNQKVKIESADGGSPRDIINVTISKTKIAEYNRRYILMDSDIPISDKDHTFATKNNITLLLSEPLCLEGMLLNVLGQVVPTTSEDCKSKLHPQLAGHPSNKQSYRVKFPKPILDTTQKKTVVTLRKVLANKDL